MRLMKIFQSLPDMDNWDLSFFIQSIFYLCNVPVVLRRELGFSATRSQVICFLDITDEDDIIRSQKRYKRAAKILMSLNIILLIGVLASSIYAGALTLPVQPRAAILDKPMACSTA